LERMKYVLTLDFALKMLQLDERRKCIIPTIIQGETGVGKTELVRVYSKLLNLGKERNPDVLFSMSTWLIKELIPKIKDKELLQMLKKNLTADSKTLADRLISAIEKSFTYFEKESEEKKKVGIDSTMDWLRNDVLENLDEVFGKDLKEKISSLNLDPTKATKEFLLEIIKEIILIPRVSLALKFQTSFAQMIRTKLLKEIENETLKADIQILISEEGKERVISIFQRILLSNIGNDALQLLPHFIEETLKKYSILKREKNFSDIFERFKNELSQELAIQLLNNFLSLKPEEYFFRIMVHAALTLEDIKKKLYPIKELAKRNENYIFTVFFDEVNTSSCLGVFKEIMMDNRLNGITLPSNIYWVAAMNPF